MVRHYKSFFNGFEIDSLDLFVGASEKKIKSELSGYINDTRFMANGDLDFTDKNLPTYNLSGKINSFDISRFNTDSLNEVNSNLNLSFAASGRSFDVDSLTGNINLSLGESDYNNTSIIPADFKLNIQQVDSVRSINLESDILDFKIEGIFHKNAIDIYV